MFLEHIPLIIGAVRWALRTQLMVVWGKFRRWINHIKIMEKFSLKLFPFLNTECCLDIVQTLKREKHFVQNLALSQSVFFCLGSFLDRLHVTAF